MAVAYVNVGTASTASASSRTPALPASRVNGNLLLAICTSKNNETHNCSTSGWVKFDQRNSGTGHTTSIWWRIVDGSEAAPVIAWTTSAACYARVAQFSGTMLDVNLFGDETSSNGTTSTHSTTAITTTKDNSLVIYIDCANANTALAQPSGWTERYDAGNSTQLIRQTLGDKSVATSGSSSGNISVTGANAAWMQWQIELKEYTPEVPDKGTELFNADMEEGNIYGEGFDNITENDGKSSLDINTNRPYAGDYSLEYQSLTDSDGSGRTADKDFSNQPELIMEVRFRIEGGRYAAQYDAGSIIRFANEDHVGSLGDQSELNIGIRAWNSDAVDTLTINGRNVSGAPFPGTSISQDTWHYLEMYYKAGDGDGYIVVKLNGAFIHWQFGLSNLTYDIARINTGYWGNALNAGSKVIFDNLVVYLPSAGGTVYELVALPAHINITPKNSALLFNRKLNAVPGEINVNPELAVLAFTRKISAVPAEVNINSQNSGLYYHRRLNCQAASVEITPINSGLLFNRKLNALPAEININPGSAALSFVKLLSALPASINVNSMNAQLLFNRRLNAVQSDINITAYSAKLIYNRILNALNVSVNVNPYDAQLLHIIDINYEISFAEGVFTDAHTFEFDVLISSTNLFLTAYQIAIGFNQDIINSGTLSFEYLTGTSQLTNIPVNSIGVINVDSVFEFAFASDAGGETISTTKKIGRFRATNSQPFLVQNPELAFDFTGTGTSIIAGEGFGDITDQEMFNSALLFDYLMTCEPASVEVTAYNARLLFHRILSVQTAHITLTSYEAQLLVDVIDYLLTCIPGHININTYDTRLLYYRILKALPAGIILTAYDVQLIRTVIRNFDPETLTADMISALFSSKGKFGNFTSLNGISQFRNESVTGNFKVIT